ncbi:MAG: hypothetical protein KBT20_04390 [Bacteroidales bacterium]|nr:hypothetical protein [Candidatus Liminaster caballi]
MKKILLFAMGLMASASVFATDLWTGSHSVWWENTLSVEADKFSEMKVGDKIVFEFTVQFDDVVELKSNGQKLPGTRYHQLYTDQTSFEVFSTPAMLAQLKATGLEVCGCGYTLNKIWFGDGKDNVTENTIWTGFFWMDSWSTLEIWKECLPESLDGYSAIRFCSEAGRTDYFIKVLVGWDADQTIADRDAMTMTNDYAEIDLTALSAQKKALFYASDRVMIQCNKESGDPFNFTSIELVKNTTALESVNADATAVKCYDILGREVSDNTKGLVIKNGKKYIQK